MSFFKLLLYDVGDGTRVKFWKHVWCGDRTLQEAFLKLYCISRTKDSSVAEVMCWSGGRIHWDAKFCRPPPDWEQESFDLFMDMVYFTTVRVWVQIGFVGSQQGVEGLRFEDSIFLSILLPSYLSLGK